MSLRVKQVKPMHLWQRPTSDLTWKRVAALRELASLGVYKAQAARLIGVHEVTVSQLAGRYDIVFLRRHRKKVVKTYFLPSQATQSPLRKLVAQRYAEGVPPSLIAAEVGKTPKHVMVMASQMGLTRGRNDPAKYRRGFDVPDAIKDEYLKLGRKKRLSAHARARVFGLTSAPDLAVAS